VITLLFSQQLEMSIADGRADPQALTSVLSALDYLDRFQTTNSGMFGFPWITKILNSGYPDHVQYRIAAMVVQLIGKEIDARPPNYFYPSWIPPLLGFLSLGEKFYTGRDPPYAGFTAFQILLRRRVDTDFGPTDYGATLLPILTSTLLPTHPLQSRSLSLMAFHRFMPWWFSQQIETVSNQNLNKLLQAVGDPFKFTDLPLEYGKPRGVAKYKPMLAAVILLEFASSDLWRDHLSSPNFTSFDELVSTDEGRTAALRCMLDTTTHTWPTFLRTPAKITAAIRRLEELQCLSTAEVVVLWAWTAGVVNVADRGAWKLIEWDTLEFYQAHGIERLAALKRHLICANRIVEAEHLEFLLQGVNYKGSPCRVERVRRPVTITEEVEEKYLVDLRVAQVCRLRRLYHLFGYDSVTWEEAVAVKEMGGEMDVTSGRSVIIPVQFMDCACDYP